MDVEELIICDDVHNNTAFVDLVTGRKDAEWFTVEEPRRSGYVGGISKEELSRLRHVSSGRDAIR